MLFQNVLNILPACCLFFGAVFENPSLDDIYLSEEDESSDMTKELSSSKNVESRPTADLKASVVATAPAPAPATTVKKASGKSKEPLQPIPQHHYERAAQQIQRNKSSAVSTAATDIRMKLVPSMLLLFLQFICYPVSMLDKPKQCVF